MSDLYRWLYSRIGGRPWTYIIRDIYHSIEWLVIVANLMLGVLMGKFLSWSQVGMVIAVFTIGYVAGHLFWGTPYKHGQRGTLKNLKKGDNNGITV